MTKHNFYWEGKSQIQINAIIFGLKLKNGSLFSKFDSSPLAIMFDDLRDEEKDVNITAGKAYLKLCKDNNNKF